MTGATALTKSINNNLIKLQYYLAAFYSGEILVICTQNPSFFLSSRRIQLLRRAGYPSVSGPSRSSFLTLMLGVQGCPVVVLAYVVFRFSSEHVRAAGVDTDFSTKGGNIYITYVGQFRGRWKRVRGSELSYRRLHAGSYSKR